MKGGRRKPARHEADACCDALLPAPPAAIPELGRRQGQGENLQKLSHPSQE